MEGRSAGVAHECRSAQPGSEPAVVPAAAMHVGAVPLHCRCIELTTLTVSSILLRSRPAPCRSSGARRSWKGIGPQRDSVVGGSWDLHCTFSSCAPLHPSCLLTYRRSSVESGTVHPCSALFSRTRHGPVHARHAAAGAFRRAPARCLTTFSLFTPAARPAPHHEDRHLPARPPAARQRQVRCCAAAAAAVWCCRLSAALRRPWHALFGPLIAL